MTNERCVHGHELKKMGIFDEVLSVAAEHYYCESSYCRTNLIFCKICKASEIPHRSIIYQPISRSIINHMLIFHGGIEGIRMSGYDFMFPTYFMYLKTKELFYNIRGYETMDEIRSFMQTCEYICVVCKNSYDSIPSKEVVVSHLRSCVVCYKN